MHKMRFGVFSTAYIGVQKVIPAMQKGSIRTTFEVNTTGVVHSMAHVDHVMREARMTMQSRPSPVGDGA